jgi:hypothetical protein
MGLLRIVLLQGEADCVGWLAFALELHIQGQLQQSQLLVSR